MFIFLKRWLLYLFVPMGLVLLFFPLNTHHLKDTEKNFVFLKISETLVAKDKESEVKPKFMMIDTSSEKTMEGLKKELQKMQKLFSEETSTINPYGYPVLHSNDLIPYPDLQSEVKDMMQMIALPNNEYTRSKRLKNVSVEEWNRFKKSFLSNVDTGAFQYGNQIFKGYIKSSQVSVEVEIGHLKLLSKMMGILFLFLSFFLFRGLYVVPSKGIQIGKRKIMIIWDILIMTIAIFFTSAFFDGMLVHYFQTPSVYGDAKMALFMGIFWITLANLIMALFTTATAVQTVWITQKGITVKGLFGRKYIAWSDMKNIQLSDYFMARKVYGFYAPRKVMKVLNIQGDVSTLRIMEPPLASTKEEILDMLMLYAPDALKKTIFDLSKEWMSVW